MKKVILMAFLSFPFAALADHMDVLQLQLDEGCSVAQYAAIMKDFNEQWGKDYGYEAELAVPLQSNDLASVFWVGRSANAEAFGKAWDAWRDAQSEPTSLAAKLEARLEACGQMIQARRS